MGLLCWSVVFLEASFDLYLVCTNNSAIKSQRFELHEFWSLLHCFLEDLWVFKDATDMIGL